MKKIYSLLVALFVTFGAMATQYCNTPLQNGDNTIGLTCLNPEENVYTIVVTGEGITGVGGSFCYINENETYQLNAEGHFVLEDGKVTFTVQSTTAPKLYTPLYILMPGEVAYTWPDDVEWVAECAASVESKVIYKWDGSGAGDDGVAEEVGGEMSVWVASGENIKIGNKQKGNWTVKLNKGYKSAAEEQFSVIITLDEELEAGDKLTLGAFKTTNKEAVLDIEFNADIDNLNQNVVVELSELQMITSDSIPGDEVIEIPEAAAGMRYIRLYRKSGSTGIYISKFLITRGEKEQQPEVKQMLNNPIGADGRFIVKWDCENEKFAESNDFEADETFTFAVDITGTVYEEFVKKANAEGATRSLAFNKWSDKGDFNGDAVRLLPIKDNIYGATFNLFQEGSKDLKEAAAVEDAVLYIYGQIFCYEYTAENPGIGWWIWPIEVQEFKAVDSDCFFATLPYTGTKTSPEFVNSDMPGLFETAYGNVPGYGVACGTLPVVDSNYPTEAAPDAEGEFPRVATVFSDKYGLALNPNFYANWGQSTQFELKEIDGDNYLYYTNFNYQGWEFSPVIAAGMTNLHISIWAPTTGSINVYPIYGGEGLTTDDSHKVTLATEAGKWVEYNIDLEKELPGLELGSIFQFKFADGVDVTTFAIDNVYFYNPEELGEDTEAPKDLKVEIASIGYFDATLKVSATDNSGVVYYGAFVATASEEEEPVILAMTAGASGAEVILQLNNLPTNTKFANIIVTASDESGNMVFAYVPEFSTLAGPEAAPVPTREAENVISLYSDAYLPATWFGIGGWGQATKATEVELAEDDNAYMLTNFNYLGWEISNNQPSFDASEMTDLHLDVWTADGNATLNVTPIWGGEKPTSVGTLKAGWNQIDMPLSTWEGIKLDNIYQIKFDGGKGETLFIDNVYFYKDINEGVENIEALNIRINGGQIDINGNAGKRVTIYNVAGQVLYNAIATGNDHIALQRGQVVIIRIADQAAKVVL